MVMKIFSAKSFPKQDTKRQIFLAEKRNDRVNVWQFGETSFKIMPSDARAQY
jgi:hypothetical protein